MKHLKSPTTSDYKKTFFRYDNAVVIAITKLIEVIKDLKFLVAGHDWFNPLHSTDETKQHK